MKTYARIVDGIAVDVTTSDPTELFHPEIAAQFVEVPDGTAHGDRLVDGAWVKYVPPDPVEAARVYELLTPMTFYMAFKPAERIAIKTSTDPVVAEFWFTFDLSVKLDKPVDPNLKSVVDGLQYLVSLGILTGDRLEPIKLGIPQ